MWRIILAGKRKCPVGMSYTLYTWWFIANIRLLFKRLLKTLLSVWLFVVTAGNLMIANSCYLYMHEISVCCCCCSCYYYYYNYYYDYTTDSDCRVKQQIVSCCGLYSAWRSRSFLQWEKNLAIGLQLVLRRSTARPSATSCRHWTPSFVSHVSSRNQTTSISWTMSMSVTIDVTGRNSDVLVPRRSWLIFWKRDTVIVGGLWLDCSWILYGPVT